MKAGAVRKELEDKRGTVDEMLPHSQNITLALQHVLVMYSGAVAVPLMLGTAVGLTAMQRGMLVCADLLVCGIATLLQTLGLSRHIGIRLPLMMGVTFVALKPMIAIGTTLGMSHIYGAIMITSLIAFFGAGIFSRLRKFFPPVVIGSVIVVTGLSLVPIAIQWAAGGTGAKDWGCPQHYFIAATVIVIIALVTRFSGSFMRSCAVLLGMLGGSVAAFAFGHIDITAVSRETIIAIPIPLWFGIPRFDAVSILSMSLVTFICFAESTGVFFATGEAAGVAIDEGRIAGGLRAEALATFLGSIFNSFPYITFSQNLGLVLMTGIRSRFVVATGGIILIILGLLPKLGALFASIPPEVLGGASIVMFGMVSVAGIRMLSEVDLGCCENQYIISLSAGLGLGTSLVPHLFDGFHPSLSMILSNGIVVTTFIAITLNILFAGRKGRTASQANNSGS